MMGCVMTDELEIIWKEVVVFLIEVLSRYFPGEMEETHENPRSG
jgi:hypothetical protein